jgi:hypothetical protein
VISQAAGSPRQTGLPIAALDVPAGGRSPLLRTPRPRSDAVSRISFEDLLARRLHAILRDTGGGNMAALYLDSFERVGVSGALLA